MDLNRNKSILFTILMQWRGGKRRKENERRKKEFRNGILESNTGEKLFYLNLKV